MTNSPTESLVARAGRNTLEAAAAIEHLQQLQAMGFDIAEADMIYHGDMLGAALGAKVAARLIEAAERLSTLEAALRPFAECIDRLAPGDDIAHWRLTDALNHGLTVEHVIRARTALSNEPGK